MADDLLSTNTTRNPSRQPASTKWRMAIGQWCCQVWVVYSKPMATTSCSKPSKQSFTEAAFKTSQALKWTPAGKWAGCFLCATQTA